MDIEPFLSACPYLLQTKEGWNVLEKNVSDCTSGVDRDSLPGADGASWRPVRGKREIEAYRVPGAGRLPVLLAWSGEPVRENRTRD
jgi:hypothetical protein